MFLFFQNFSFFWHFSGHEFWPTWQDFHQKPCVSTGRNFFLGHFTDCNLQQKMVPLMCKKAYVKFEVIRASLSKRLRAQFSKPHYQWKWFSKVSDFFYFDKFCLHGCLKWSCRTSTTTPRVLERESLRVTPFPFVRRAMGTANCFKTKRSKLKFWLRSGNEVAYRQYLRQTLAAGLINNTPRVVALSRNEAWRSGGSATTRGVLFISRVSVF